MSITLPEPVAQRGKKDARRHREKQREAIRENLPEIISEESIITRSKGRTVKVPIRSLDIPHLRRGSRNRGDAEGNGQGVAEAGVGQGPGSVGDVIGRRPGHGQKPGGEPGSEPGEDYIESEIELEELIGMMLEDLGLPNLEEKEAAELEVISGFKIRGIQKSGPKILLDAKTSSKSAFGRLFAYLQTLVDETGRDDLTCFSALKQGDGDLGQALKILEDPDFRATETEIEPFGLYHKQDLRYHKVQPDVHRESDAVVLAMMDVSGSMTVMKKYMARSLLFWLVEFLRTIYTKVEVRFIVHHVNARLVAEDEFFRTVESGGTRCSSAYQLANSLIDTEYPTDRWNVYALHFSDGEDWEAKASVQEAKKLIEKGANMFGYGEIHVGDYRSYGNLLPAFKEAFSATEQEVTVDGTTMKVYAGSSDIPFLGVVIEDRKHIWPALKEFLKRDRWSK